jgi:hypothetical protein
LTAESYKIADVDEYFSMKGEAIETVRTVLLV